ncbi:hypothetical protein BJ322DRAFT_1113597 [Thelephora terrestris]|uniref:Uncharacterized protein n=1 Tax=Thelephora terrestris TaxID=56493 RepID=A0A9P6H569_9AGAM|nr:hypothetical protein BJ322DRAFT_1113597 [Thelephora terrestris]
MFLTDLDSIQASYDIVYPIFPARIRHSDAVYHPTISSLGVLRNHLASAAITAVQRHLTNTFRRKRLDTIHARADYITQLFKSDGDHPIIWREYVVGDIPNHPGTRRGVFQSDPILETLLSYYSSSGIMEAPTCEDPGVGDRPIGVLALATAAVERAYKMHATGDFITSGQQFNTEFWGPTTVKFMDYLANDLNEHHWNSIFSALSSFSAKVSREEAIYNNVPEEEEERVPLPPSDPPSPAADRVC